MASITIRNLSPESKAKLRRRAEQRGCSLEALARSILDQAAEDTSVATGFPDDLIALVHRMQVATRNVADFEPSGVALVNLWD